MRISDWSSDVCSSDLIGDDPNSDDRWQQHQLALLLSDDGRHYDPTFLADAADKILFSNTDVNWASLGTPDHQYAYDGYRYAPPAIGPDLWEEDRKSGGTGKRGSVRVDTGGGGNLKKTIQ